MRIALLFLSITLLSVSGAFANDSLSEQSIETSFITDDTNILVAANTSDTDSKPLSVSGDNNINSFEITPYNLDNIIDMIKKSDDIKSFTQDKIDLLANFRDGDDVVVPLGFFLYMNKKF